MMMLEESMWHPVALAQAVGAAPMAASLLGRELVLWRDETGEVRAFLDKCPHRGARLSLGRVVQGRLECPYHGWQFAAHGACKRVPALPDFVPPPTQCANAFDACVAYGLVWVRLSPSQTALPVFGAESDLHLRKLNCGPYEVSTSAPRIVENFLDMAHFGYVHEGWLGVRERTAIDDYLVEATAHGLRATGCKTWQPQSNVHSTIAAHVEYSYEVAAPYMAVLTKVPEAGSTALPGWREAIALFICPITPQTCRVWFRLAVADFDTAEETLRKFQNTIFDQDRPVLESQQPKTLPLDPRAELHTAADKASSAYRRYLKKTGITFGVC